MCCRALTVPDLLRDLKLMQVPQSVYILSFDLISISYDEHHILFVIFWNIANLVQGEEIENTSACVGIWWGEGSGRLRGIMESTSSKRAVWKLIGWTLPYQLSSSQSTSQGRRKENIKCVRDIARYRHATTNDDIIDLGSSSQSNIFQRLVKCTLSSSDLR